jgi:hypothetical protein
MTGSKKKGGKSKEVGVAAVVTVQKPNRKRKAAGVNNESDIDCFGLN